MGCCEALNNYCTGCCTTSFVPDADDGSSQGSRDSNILWTRLSHIVFIALFLLSIVFCALMMSYSRPLNFYIPLFAVTLALAPTPILLRHCCCEAPKAPPSKKKEEPPPAPPLVGAL